MLIQKRQSPFSLCIFPGYKWCGPGCSGPGKPVNDVDECCYYHDQCLSQGYSPCYCDKKFMECLRPKINPNTQKGKNAHLMYEFMKVKTWFGCPQERRF